MSRPHSLPSLTPREAIADAVYRALLGFDRNDWEIFTSALVADDNVTLELRGAGPSGESMIFTGRDQIRATLFTHIGQLDTTHMTSNMRINVAEGADTASLTCYGLAQHCPPGKGKQPDGPRFLTGGEYSVDLVRDEKDGLWKIRKFANDLIWGEGDASIVGR